MNKKNGDIGMVDKVYMHTVSGIAVGGVWGVHKLF